MTIKSGLITAFLALASFTANAQEGTWSGELDVQGTKLPLVFHFAKDGCTMDSPSQGAKGLKAEKSITPEGKVKVVIPSIAASFEGYHVMKMITGTFIQGGISLPLTLKEGAPEIKRPQTPKAPFPYKTEEVSFSNGEWKFNGTLTLPEKCTKQTPVVLMVTGSGLQNRDEEMLDHKPFAVIADALARAGIASLRYDDRGYGMEGFVYTDHTTLDAKSDAEKGLELLRKRFGKVGVLGHSEGGTIAFLLASEGKTDFIVSLAGMVISGRETLLGQNRESISSIQLPDDMKESLMNAVETVFDQLAKGTPAEEMLSNLNLSPDLKPLITASLQQFSTPYFKEFITLDPSKSLSKVKCPVLALNGTKDTQVDCKANLEALKKGLVNCKPTIQSFEGLNHLFQHCTTGNLTEYQQIEETISPEVLKTITDWLKKL